MTAERWRRPAAVIDVDEQPADVFALAPGRLTTDVVWTLTPETVARIKLGYVCLNCLEPHEQAWPALCSVCAFPMRDAQLERFGRLYEGEERLKGGGVDADLARMTEDSERRERVAAGGPSQILLPRGVRL